MRTVEAADVTVPFDLDTLVAVLREHPVRLAILFGSHTQDKAHATSDIDIAVVFETVHPEQPEYNDVFLGLSAELSRSLETDAVDLIDLHRAPTSVVDSVFEHGLLLVGDPTDAAEIHQQLRATATDERSPRERLDAALASIDAHLDGRSEATASGGLDGNQ